MLAYYLLFLFNILTYPLYIYKKNIYLEINCLLIWLIMGLRNYSVGSDTLSYINTFSESPNLNLPAHLINWLIPVNNSRYESGFLLLNKIIYSINSNPRFFLLSVSAIMIVCLVVFLVKLNVNYFIGILTFETMGFFSFFMSGMRQALACSFCMLAFVYAINRKPIKFLVFNFLAISMHVTAILFLLVYPMSYLKNKIKINVVIYSVFIIAIYLFDSIYTRISSLNYEAGTYSDAIVNNNYNGLTNIIISCLILLFFICLEMRMLKKNPIVNDIKQRSLLLTKYTLMFALGFYLFAIRFSQISRIALYFLIGYFVVFDYLISETKKNVLWEIGLIAFMISYFVAIQILRPQWTNITPYVFM